MFVSGNVITKCVVLTHLHFIYEPKPTLFVKGHSTVHWHLHLHAINSWC